MTDRAVGTRRACRGRCATASTSSCRSSPSPWVGCAQLRKRASTFAIALPPPTGGSTPATVKVTAAGGEQSTEFDAVVRIDTPGEAAYYRNGGIMQYVLRSLLGR